MDAESDESSSVMPVDPVLIVTVGVEAAVDGIGHEAVHTAESWLVWVLARREIARRLMIAVCTLMEMTLRAYASVLRGVSTTGIVLHGWWWWCMRLLTMKTRSHESWRRSCCSAEARRSAHTVTVTRLAWMGTHPSMASGVAPDPQRVLRETDANTSLVTVVQLYTIQLVKCMRCISNVLVLDEAHGSILLCTEAKSLESSALGE